MTRKRAVCKMPLDVIESALNLGGSQVIMSIAQSYVDMRHGRVELIGEGSGLEEHFSTSGPCVEGQVLFCDRPDGRVEMVVIPPDSSKK